MNTTTDTPSLYLNHTDYRIRSHWSGQVGFVAGAWHHAHWTDVISRVDNMYRIARESGRNITRTVAYMPNGARKVSFVFDNKRIEAQESVILWIMPA